jgi:hypothetical protein
MGSRAHMRGVTALEAAAAFAVLGSILLIGVPAFLKEIHASKQAEATINVALLGDDAIAYASDKPAALAFPASAPLTPASVPRGVREADPPGAWDHPTWQALGFRPFAEGVPHAYAFQFDSSLSPGKSSFRAHAHGDLDGDGTTSTFEVRGSAEDGTPARMEPGIIVEAELE